MNKFPAGNFGTQRTLVVRPFEDFDQVYDLTVEPICRIVKETFNEKGVLHSINDQPALEYEDGELAWYRDGKLHRGDDKPAIINKYVKKWYHNGNLHRDGFKCAIEHPRIKKSNGRRKKQKTQFFYKRGGRYALSELERASIVIKNFARLVLKKLRMR